VIAMKVTERGQVTIPKALRERYGFGPDTDVEVVPGEQGLVIRKRTTGQHPVDQVRGILGKAIDVDAYIEEIRGR
jgi:antitoxin PrlF